MRLRNTNPMGDVDLPLIGKSLKAGEEFDIDDELGEALLMQTGNFEQVETPEANREARDPMAIPETTENQAETPERSQVVETPEGK